MSSLTALEVKRAASQRTDKVRTLNDGQGLNLVIPAEGKPGNPRWTLRFSHQGKESMRGLGSYPEVSLLKARQAAVKLKAQILNQGPPAPKNRAAVAQPSAPEVVTFKVAAERWYAQTSGHLSEKHRAQVISTLRAHAYPALGNKRVDAIRPGDVETIIRDMLRPPTPMLETASRVYQRINSVFEYAGRHGWCTSNPAGLLRSEVTRLKKQVRRNSPPGHHASLLDDVGISTVLKAIAAYPANQTRAALQAITGAVMGCR